MIFPQPIYFKEFQLLLEPWLVSLGLDEHAQTRCLVVHLLLGLYDHFEAAAFLLKALCLSTSVSLMVLM